MSHAQQHRQRFEEQTRRQLRDQFDIETIDLHGENALPASLRRKTDVHERYSEQHRRLRRLIGGDHDGDDDDERKYGGKTVTRRELVVDSQSSSSSSSSSGSESDDDDDDNLEHLLQNDEHRRELMRVKEMMEQEEEEESSSDDDDDDVDLREHVGEMTRNETALLSNVHQQKLKEQQKAKHVFNQKLFFDQLLKLRIMIQGPLSIANRLPQHDVFEQFMQVLEPEAQESLQSVQSTLQSILKDLVTMQYSLLRRNTQVSEAIDGMRLTDGDKLDSLFDGRTSGKKGRTADGSVDTEYDDLDDPLWQALHGNYSAYKRYREESLERWSRRTRLQSVEGKDLKTLNMGILQRVERVLRDRENLVNRTRINRLGEKILGKRMREEEEAKDGDDEEDELMDVEIFDDRDFYQKLLRNLIEDVGASVLDHSGEGTSSRSFSTSLKEALARRAKSKDRAAQRKLQLGKTKGRTIKYAVHPKMVSFMAPQERTIPESADALFSNLFGGYWPVPRPTVSETEEDGEQQQDME